MVQNISFHIVYQIALSYDWILNSKVFIEGEDDIYDEENDMYFSSSQVSQFGYSLLVFAVYFVTECIPVPVTSMLPYIFFPLFGLSSGWFLIGNNLQLENY